ncbi:MAG: FAD-dependent oxidoreductase, partial [Proteobacteria bacterium]|nr:FAD-dependent oxidoreductase [Pseudomonadota bacterium]
GLVDGLTFLRDINLGNPPKPRRKMVVIGGGNTAIDCARTAKRLGYNSVAILYRRTREEMPANSWEVDEAMEEGIDIQFLTAPVKIVAENGKVSGVACVRMKLGDPDESGRRRPIPIDGSEFEVKTNLVVSAIGQAPDLGCLSKEPGINTSQKGLVIADPLTGTTSIAGIFAGGDVVSGPRTVVEAVSSGKRAAIAIDRYLTGGNISSRQERDWKGIRLEFEGADLKEREFMPLLSLSERKRTFKEIELGFSEEKARNEADRCLRICGIQKLP